MNYDMFYSKELPSVTFCKIVDLNSKSLSKWMNEVFSQSNLERETLRDWQPRWSFIKHSTWHDDLREAHLASHSCWSVHQVREVFPYLMDVSGKQLHSHPQAWWYIKGIEGRDQDNVSRSQPESKLPQENTKKRFLLVLSTVSCLNDI